jgi:eukaryotic-like serine/threonine-protein kinase
VGGEFVGTERYSIIRRLGAGGMGVVYEALDRRENRRVALKTVRRGEGATIYRLKREFRSLADVAHPNLVALHELVSDEQHVFFTMDLVPGVDFLRWVRGSSSSCDEAMLRRLRAGLPQLVAGVSALHASAKIHRDLKPSNVLVTDDDRIVVLDFGLVADLDGGYALETVDSVSGTPEYMAPEQAAGETLTVASDWYAVGALLYQILTGTPPFAGPRLQVLVKKQKEEPRRPRELEPTTPADLDALCMHLLSRDPVTRAAGEHILSWVRAEPSLAASTTIHPTQVARFVGRTAELEALRAAFARVREGQPTFVHVAGASGFGKTALVRTFVAELAESGAGRAIRGRCHERESVPFKALDSMVDSLTRELMRLPRARAAAMLPRDVHALARIFPVLRRVEAVADVPRRSHETPDPQELRRRAFGALREILARLSDAQDLVVWIDDLQWADADSAMLLTELVRPPDPPNVLLIVSYRSEGAAETPGLAALLAARRSMTETAGELDIEVGPLSPAESRLLAEALLGGDAAVIRPFVRSIAKDAAGSPFLIEQLARVISVGEGIDRTNSGRVRLDTMIASRLETMPRAARSLAMVLAVAGRPIQRQMALRAAGLSGAEEAEAIAALRAASWVRSHHSFEGEELDFYQARIRDAVLRACPPVEIASIHGKLARVHEAAAHPDPEAMTLHLKGAGENERAGVWAEAAAARASGALAFDRAASWLRMAIELRPLGSDEERIRRRKLGDALINAGRGAEAAVTFRDIARNARPAEALECRRQAADQLLRSGRVDEGLEVLGEVLQHVNVRWPRSAVSLIVLILTYRLLLRIRGARFVRRDLSDIAPSEIARVDACFTCATGLAIVSSLRAIYFSHRGALFALSLGEPMRAARALATTAMALASEGESRRTRTDRLLAGAVGAAKLADSTHATEFVSLITGTCRFLEGHWRESLSKCDAAEINLRDKCSGVAWERATAQLFSLWALYYSGRLKELSMRVPRILAEARELGDLYSLTNVRVGRPAVRWLLNDDPGGAIQDVEDAMSQWSRAGVHQQHYYACVARVMALLYKGDGDGAAKLLDESWKSFDDALVFRIQTCRLEALHLRGCVDVMLASSPRRRRRALAAARAIARERAPYARLHALLILAGVARHDRRLDDAITLLRDCIREADASDMELHAAAARRHYAELTGDTTEGERARGYFAVQGVRDVARFVRFVAP